MIVIHHPMILEITTVLNPSSPLSRQKHLLCMDVRRAELAQSRQAHVTVLPIADSPHLRVSAICGLRRLTMKWVSLVVLPSQTAPANLPCQDCSGLLTLFNTTMEALQMSKPRASQTPLSFLLHILIFENQIQIELFPLTIHLLTFLTAFLFSFVHTWTLHRLKSVVYNFVHVSCLHSPTCLSSHPKLHHLHASCLISYRRDVTSSTHTLRDFIIVASSSRARVYVVISYHVASLSTIISQWMWNRILYI